LSGAREVADLILSRVEDLLQGNYKLKYITIEDMITEEDMMMIDTKEEIEIEIIHQEIEMIEMVIEVVLIGEVATMIEVAVTTVVNLGTLQENVKKEKNQEVDLMSKTI
jgi:hypothetical protein